MEISAVFLTRNSEKLLEAALESVEGIASEIVVVDDHSTDRTRKIARKYTSRIYDPRGENSAERRNLAAGLAAFPWILTLEADERLSQELRDEVKILASEEPENVAFSAKRGLFFLGRWVRHGGRLPQHKTFLYRKDSARWILDYPRDQLRVEGREKNCEGTILQFPSSGIAEQVRTIDELTDRRARNLYSRKKKCRLGALVLVPPARFFKSYLLKKGILDGVPGLILSLLEGYSAVLECAKLREIWKKAEHIEPLSD